MKNIAIEAARKAGTYIMKNFRKIKVTREKAIGNIVTNVDIESERIIVETIKKKFPDHNIIAEESGETNNNSLYTWIIDPVDGTTNYARLIPFFNVSIALRKNKEIILGLVYNPFLNELFLAEKGKGATLNGKPIQTSLTQDPKRAFICFCDGHGIKQREESLKVLQHFKTTVADIRKLGAAELELAYVACGRIDGFIIFGANIWDWGAGCLIVEEAGGKVTDFNGNKLTDKTKDRIIASNKFLHKDILRKCKEVF